MRRELLYDGYDPEVAGKATIGLRGVCTCTNSSSCGTRSSVSSATGVALQRNQRANRALGIEAAVAEPCLPIQAYHGHVRHLLNEGADWLFIPNMINAETPFAEMNSYYCRGADATVRRAEFERLELRSGQDHLPAAAVSRGSESDRKALAASLAPLGERRKAVAAALAKAYAKQAEFKSALWKRERGHCHAVEDERDRYRPRRRCTICTIAAPRWTSEASCATITGQRHSHGFPGGG